MVLDRLGHLLGMLGEHVIGALEHPVVDADALLGVQLVHQLAHRALGHEFVGVAVQHQPAARAGGEEAEIVVVRRRRDADPAGNLRPAHQQLHADERTERIPGDPQTAVVRVHRLHPVERGGGVADLADAAVIAALAATDSAKIEPHHRAAEPLERLIHRVGHPIVHRPAVQRMRMKDQRDRRTGLLRVVITALEPAVRAGKHHLWHGVPKPLSCPSGGAGPRPPWAPPPPLRKAYSPSPRARSGVTIR